MLLQFHGYLDLIILALVIR